MQVEGIISSPVSEDIRAKGHLSIRLSKNCFSFLVSDASYKPVLLKQYTWNGSHPSDSLPSECGRILEGLQLQGFHGEVVIMVDNQAFSLVPDPFDKEEHARPMLEGITKTGETDLVRRRTLPDRRMTLLYGYREGVEQLASRLGDHTLVIHGTECLVSLADQVQASDHQRGFFLAEVQQQALQLLVVREDNILLLNRYELNETSDFVYHVLNTYRQLDMERERVPVYLAGTVHPEHELFGLLGKYIRHVRITPYYLEELTRQQVLRFMLLSEASKCV